MTGPLREFSALATIIVFAMSAMVSAAAAESGPIVAVTGGQVQGGALQKGGAVFKGVPFAQPPVGALRWREPTPVKPWNGVRDATDFGSPCTQSPQFNWGGTVAKEDCLYLNVWTPEWP